MARTLTALEIAHFAQLWESDRSVTEIARALGTTWGAVMARAQAIGLEPRLGRVFKTRAPEAGTAGARV